MYDPEFLISHLPASRSAGQQREEGSSRRLGAQLSETISAQVYKAPIEGGRATEVAES